MNKQELTKKVTAAMNKILREKGIVSPVEVLIEIGALTKPNYENWRLGRIPYLEKVCAMNLHKLSTVMREIRAYARKHQLKESWTMYKKWGNKGKVIPLRFSKSGNEYIERSYATHYITEQNKEDTGLK